MAKGFVHTVYKRETWLNELEEGEGLPGTYATQEEAAAAGRERAIRNKTEHVIHKQDGEFGERSVTATTLAGAAESPGLC